ncbi:MAG: hypothetical protein AAF922_04420 [Pseudomonadota bacterium]
MDMFADYSSGLESPASHAFDAVPSDTNDLPSVGRAVNVATTGTVRLTTSAGDTVTITVVAGVAFPIRAKRVWATGTTATGVVVLF